MLPLGDHMIYYKDYIEEDLFIPKILKYKKKEICDDILCFDIETCNYFTDGNKVYSIKDVFEKNKYRVDRIQKDFETLEAGAVPYIWMFGIGPWVLYGRELPEFAELLDYIKEKTDGARTDIWIHNLSFEYTYLREIVNFDDKFFTDARQPLFVSTDNIIFRCSYRLTNLSLAKWGDNIGVAKKTGDLDYHKLYTPLSELSEKEKGYCKADIDVMKAGIKQYLDEYKHICLIPYTQTGIPRKHVKSLNQKQKGWIQKVAECQPKNLEEWRVQHMAYSGGLTLVNPELCGRVLHDIVSYDRKSAYPACMLYKFPCTAFVKTNQDVNWEDGNHHICLVVFHGLKARYSVTPLSSSKRILTEGAVFNKDDLHKNNGKIISAVRFALYMTEVDYSYIKEFYTWDEMQVVSHWFALSDYMPKHIIEFMLGLYADKTLLKNGDPVIYLRKKEMLNCLYGMAASMLVHNVVEEKEDFTFEIRRKTPTEGTEELAALQEKPYKNVLPYSWGLYITAYERRDLMLTALKAGISLLGYTDTDSLKGQYREKAAFFEEENKRIIAWTKERCKAQGIEFNLTCPKTPEGVPQHIGIWERDAEYYEIKFLGAKRYAYKLDAQDHVHTVIAGVPKKAWSVLQTVGALRDGVEFDLFHAHKNMITYRDGDNPQVTMPDGYKVTNTCAANIRPTSYKLTLEREFKDLIRLCLNNKKINSF